MIEEGGVGLGIRTNTQPSAGPLQSCTHVIFNHVIIPEMLPYISIVTAFLDMKKLLEKLFLEEKKRLLLVNNSLFFLTFHKV